MSAKKYNIAKREDVKKEETEDKLWIALKRHIMRERERKKQQELETAKEEQLRNEREARKKQDNIKTLGKTQEEIQQVEEQMIQLKNKKHQLFLQLKALITKEVEMENIRKESELVNVRNDIGLAYQPYSNEKGLKRPHSPATQAVLFTKQYMPPSSESGTTGNRLWYNPAKYPQAQPHHQWTMTNASNRYIQQAMPVHPILIDPPQMVVKQPPKTNSISIEKISAPDYSLHGRRLLSAVPQSGPIVYPEYLPQNRDFNKK